MWNTAYRCYGFRINSYIMARWYLNAFMFDFRSLWCSCNEKKRINFTIFGQDGEKKTREPKRNYNQTSCTLQQREPCSLFCMESGIFFRKTGSNMREMFGILLFFQYWKIQITGQTVRHAKPMKMRCDRLLDNNDPFRWDSIFFAIL